MFYDSFIFETYPKQNIVKVCLQTKFAKTRKLIKMNSIIDVFLRIFQTFLSNYFL